MADMTNPKPGPVLQHAETMDPNSQIVSKLRALYSAVEREPLPDAFLDLLQQLDSVEDARKG
ncbi:hypothetical protein G8E10_00550 [Rhizobiaceae bacterium CRRU44]|uniref:Anti-sigma factor NepR domain-containing protein n=1 Tax=Ferranicluibacter rubi TaxID=2715133 RepID=A0AA44C8Z9_9HYPH|nr:NepR family anti-sigma factor [Ferranicluibacter rubi]NHT74238.1 hypothetical protein [Ferranicluibacter rubi]TCP89103.1 hypothetical protein C8J31_102273 [Rhizobium sp. PP-CC-2G-626]TCQ12030.1 hypothetical protein C8J34_101668 [Rhizobium sp. PP-F2F-G36]